MKKFFISAAVLLATVMAHGQIMEVSSVERVNGANGETAVISPSGDYVVVNGQDGLMKVDLASGAQTLVAKGSGLYNVKISGDGNTVVYTRPMSDRIHLRKIRLESVNLADGSAKQLVAPSRKLNAGATIEGNSINVVNNGKLQVKSLDGSKAVKAPVASINYGHLDITVDGKTTTLDPLGRGSYLWPSVSPDGTKVCFWLVGRGCYTCNLDGSDLRSFGPLRAAVWADNNVIVGQDELEGNAQRLAASSIVAIDINTKAIQKLTNDEVIAMYPSVSADASRIAFVNQDGDVYVINIKK